MDVVWGFLGIGITVFCLVSAFIMPWINRAKIKSLKQVIKQLSEELEKERTSYSEEIQPQYSPSINNIKIEANDTVTNKNEEIKEEKNKIKSNTASIYKPKQDSKPKIGFEQQFGARLPVWIGGIALALAGLFLVKYSLDNNLLSPTIRVILGGILGVTLLHSAKLIRSKPDFANGVRIAQSLAGAGIAILYVVSFASARLYELIPMFAGFISMAAVTATALVLALRHGPPIAILGMAGGFLTPALLSTGEGNAFALFIYLYFTASGLMIIVRKTQLWWLSIPTIIASLLWVIIWLFSSYDSGDNIWLFLFLAGISATIIINSKQQYENNGGGIFKTTSILNYIGLAGTLVIMGVIAGKSGFGLMEWGLFGLLSLGGIALAYFNSKLYGFIPWVSMAVNIVMLFTWETTDYNLFALILYIFAIIYAGSGYFLMFRARIPILWAGLTGTTGLSYYLLAYYKLHNTSLFAEIPLFWGISALILAIAAIYALFKIRENIVNYEYKEHIYAIFAVVATSFVSLSLSIEIERDFLSVAIAGEMMAIAWINGRVSIKSLRAIIAVMACIFGLLLLPQIILMIQLTIYSLVEAKLYIQSSVPLVQWPLFQLGIPAAMFIYSSYLLRKQQDGKLVRIFEYTAIALIAVMGYYFTRNSLHPEQNVLFIKASFFERGIITNILFIYGMLCLWIGRRLKRHALSWSGIILCGAAIFRIVYFDIFLHNPIWDTQKIGGIAIFNSLLLPYGLPIAWTYITRKELIYFRKEKLAKYIGGFIIILLFTFITVNIRHIFHGEYLNNAITTNAEIYTYSVAWLLLGTGILFIGVILNDKTLRYASLGIILLTIGKVFIYDASELEGLYRVISFFGLGISLIAISYLYTRFVFEGHKE